MEALLNKFFHAYQATAFSYHDPLCSPLNEREKSIFSMLSSSQYDRAAVLYTFRSPFV